MNNDLQSKVDLLIENKKLEKKDRYNTWRDE